MSSAFVLKSEPGKDVPDALLAFLRGSANSNVEVDLSETAALSGRQIEILLAAQSQWAEAGFVVKLVNPNESLLQQLIDLGLPAKLFSEGE